MNNYLITLSKNEYFHVVAKDKPTAVFKAIQHDIFQHWKEQRHQSPIEDLLYLDCIRHTDDYIKCEGNINKNRNLAKRRK